ncbi:MAG: adenylyltransferase [endosymbiont of Galathealinum brachiosum]|uniref:Adenylyltransferase n=1 Tax=endosymbiont of Galathealinum brachiosum TaxID=2200906 RepID=A0A370D7X2_9GAMM|nr:MAG: adenylyltransferase [endosymbiont of Galathealinum brachiosum]
MKYYGTELFSALLSEEESEQLKKEIPVNCTVTLSQRQLCDLEMIMNGAMNPLNGFMNELDYNSVLENMTLNNSLLWSLPVTLDISKEQLDGFDGDTQIGLCDEEGFMLAVMDVRSVWKADKNKEAEKIYNTIDSAHPGVQYLISEVKEYYIGGEVRGMQLPTHYDFESIRHTPDALRREFKKSGWDNVVAFHTSKPMHRVHYEITTNAAKSIGANVLIHPLSGVGKPGDLAYYSRVHCYQAIMQYYPKYLAMLSLVPQAMRMAGPREAIHNMIIRQNYGCSHFIIGPEHTSPPGVRSGSRRFYERYSAQKLVAEFQNKLDIQMVPVEEMGYSEERRIYVPCVIAEKEKLETHNYCEKDLNQALEHDQPVPDWYSYPEVISELSKVRLSRKHKGLTLFFTGLSGSGKSTLAKLIDAKFIEQGDRPVTLLDGDVVRTNLSSELTFSKEHRDINVKRIGYVASEITKNRGVAICAPIAPYENTRESVRSMIEQYGAFIEIHVATSLETCEGRDRKGMYAKARKGIIKNFTGISDPYEEPVKPEIKIDTMGKTPVECAQKIMLYLFKEGYIA